MIERLTVLGAGTILPLPDYGCAGYLLAWRPQGRGAGDAAARREKSSPDGGESRERPILIDCGSGTLDRLFEHGTAVEEIELILISHFHVDHVSDLAAVLLARWLRNLRRGSEAHQVTLLGPDGLGEHVGRLIELNQPWMSEYRFEIVELGDSGSYLPTSPAYRGLDIGTGLTGHTANSICFRIADETGRTFFYSGDTDYNEALLPLASQADLALVECSMPEDKKLEGHLTPRLAGKLAAKAQVRRLLLTHFYEEVLAIDIAAEVAKEFRGAIELAGRLQSYRIAPAAAPQA